MTRENEYLQDYVYYNEIKINSVDQYSPRSDVEIRNIPENMPQSNIEKYVIKIFESIGVKVQSDDLVAVHRIGKFSEGKHRNIIVRFINRKKGFSCLKHSSKLAKSGITEYRKLFINENLCPANKQIFNYLYKLKKNRNH